MAFGTDLQGRSSHEALLGLQDCELRLLDSIKRCVTQRIKCDRDYANSLEGFVAVAHKLGSIDYMTPVCVAWSTIIQETSGLIRLIRENADKLCIQTLEQLVQIIGEKKNTKRMYADERNRLDCELSRLQDELNHLKGKYERTLSKMQQNKLKYEESLKRVKPAGSSKQDEAKNKYIRSEVKVHNLHNAYVISLREFNLCQQQYSRVGLPSLLELQQCVQENIVHRCKEILEEYNQLTDCSSVAHQKLSESMRLAVESIEPASEYKQFIKSQSTPPITYTEEDFQFELLNKHHCTLAANEIVLDDLTWDDLKQRRQTYSDQLDRCRQRIAAKKDELEISEDRHSKYLSDTSNSVSARIERQLVHTLKRELLELHGLEAKLATLVKLVSEPLDMLGNEPPPSGIQDIALLDGEALQNTGGVGLTSSSATVSSNAVNHIQHALANFKSTLNKMKPISSSGSIRRHNGGALNHTPPTPPTKDFDVPSLIDTPVEAPQIPVVVLETQQGVKSNSEDNFAVMRQSSAAFQPGYQRYSFKSEPARVSELTVHPERPLDEEEWFHGVLPREEVQRLLVNDGDYIVRSSKNRKTGEIQYVLSVMWGTHRHFIVQQSSEGCRFEGDSFPTVQELIIAQHKSGEPVTRKSEAVLKTPILKPDWELRNDDIELHNKIGSGQFGEVFRGTFKLTGVDVAVKTCRETLADEVKKKFLQEGRILKQYDHPNIVKFIGIATQRHPVMIVMEYVAGGSLLTFLRKQGTKQSVKAVVKMSEDAAAGMSYLETKNCLHRDLAARNCLVGEENIVKISDFGMSREEQEYVVSGGLKQIPIKWTAPEALNFGTYTSACDVWSFGVLMWEIFSLGSTPYTGLTNTQAREKVDEGYRMPPPDRTPDDAYQLMMCCWDQEPKSRPRFEDIHRELVRIRESL